MSRLYHLSHMPRDSVMRIAQSRVFIACLGQVEDDARSNKQKFVWRMTSFLLRMSRVGDRMNAAVTSCLMPLAYGLLSAPRPTFIYMPRA
jgi:hypothetical protein